MQKQLKSAIHSGADSDVTSLFQVLIVTLRLCVSGADCDVTSLFQVLIVTLHLCVSGADSDVTSLYFRC